MHEMGTFSGDGERSSVTRALGMAFAVALVGGSLVSVTAVLLEPRQEANRLAERRAVIDEIVSRLPGAERLLDPASGDRIETRLVDLATGRYVSDATDPAAYDALKAAQDAASRVEIPPELDIARLGARAPFAPVHLVRRGRRVELVILPVFGSGYVSTLRGYLALEGDMNTITALAFYEHGETPGLGARLQDPAWLAKWRGKRLRDPEGRYRLAVTRGAADAAVHSVDGISGATRTSQGVSRLLEYWLGAHGYGPFLERLREEGGR